MCVLAAMAGSLGSVGGSADTWDTLAADLDIGIHALAANGSSVEPIALSAQEVAARIAGAYEM